jgi:lipopolysaccharide/colanic/teichoic acid biosynthesis glycosyltransferase
MQPNPIIRQDTSVDAQESGFVNDTAGTNASHATVSDAANVLIFRRPFNGYDYALPHMRGRFVSRALRPRTPYASRSAHSQALYNLCKRGFDIAGASVLLLVTSPLFVVVALVVKATSRGPAFFRHRRLGQNGREFVCLKFRTMVVDAEERLTRDAHLRGQFEEAFKIKDDPRITRTGALLRKTSLDELPQLFQVLRGEMSLIGPRPIVERELAKYAIYGVKLLSVKPGLSGLWQVCGRSETTYPQRVMMDMHYIDHRGLRLDLQLLLLTTVAVLRRAGAC